MLTRAQDLSVTREYPFLSLLNPAQHQAATSIDGPTLVLAAAGTGKTRALTARLAYILATDHARPSEILAVTFTNKAALEMRTRVSQLVGGVAEYLWLGTFHSICVRLLRRHAPLVELAENFTILDTDDQLRLLKQILAAENIDEKRTPARMVLNVISRWKDRGLTPTQIPADQGMLQDIYRQYQERLRILNAADFGDLVMKALELFKRHPDVLRQYQSQFKHILVDEYQDTNTAQYLWLRLLTQREARLCCVGDDDQSIYGWRGADVGNILRFEQDYPTATIIRLEQNYRSTPHILGGAAGLIQHNQQRLGKSMWTDIDEGQKIRLQALWDGEEEAQFIGEEIEARQRKGQSLSSMAILLRAGFQTREFEDRFIKLAIPYRVIGGPRFYERQEIRDALAYLRLVVHQQDSLAFERVLNTPRRGIGTTTLQLLHQYARQHEVSLIHAAHELSQSDALKTAARRALTGFLQDIDRWQAFAQDHTPTDVARKILDESGYTAMLQADPHADAPGRLENLKELVAGLNEFPTLIDFLEHVSLVMENSNQPDRDVVTLMTLHGAKGLEFDTVFLAGWEEGIFPNPRALGELGQVALEEERRLAYVGITRARKEVFITFAHHRRIYNSWQSTVPSRFLGEIPPEHVEVLGNNPLGEGTSSWPHRGEATYGGRMGEGGRGRTLPSQAVIEHEDTPQIGHRVFHQKFGYGRVMAQEGDRLTIDFEHAGIKRIMAAFLKT